MSDLHGVSTWLFPNKVVFGPRAIRELPEQMKALEVRRPLLVTDAGLVKCGIADMVGGVLKRGGLEPARFAGVDPNPTEENVLAGLERYRSEECDSLVGLGGGSALDVAKAVRVKALHGLPLSEYAFIREGWKKMTEPMPPMAAIPTTAGTGSEVARGSVIIVRPSGAKVGIVSERLYPSVSICDPKLTLDLPLELTAGTGLDALTHCIEEYLSPKYNPMVDGMTLEGVRLATRSLLRAYENGHDLAARADMMNVSMIGGIGFTKGLGVIHSLSHPFGAVVGGHHGTNNAILLPAALEFNFEASLPRFRALAGATGLPTEGLSDEECGRRFIDTIRELNRKLGIPADLSALGARREHIPQMLPLCMADHCHRTNPRPCTEEDFRRLLEAHIS